MKVAVIMNAGAGSIGAERCGERIAEVEAAFAAAGSAPVEQHSST